MRGQSEVGRGGAGLQGGCLACDLGASFWRGGQSRVLLEADDILRLVSVDEVKGRLQVARRDFLNYRTTCPKCGAPIGPRQATRELMDIPPDPPYGALGRCSRCGTLTYVEFEPEVQQAS